MIIKETVAAIGDLKKCPVSHPSQRTVLENPGPLNAAACMRVPEALPSDGRAVIVFEICSLVKRCKRVTVVVVHAKPVHVSVAESFVDLHSPRSCGKGMTVSIR